MENANNFYQWASAFKERDYEFPVFFMGHGSPMNAIEDNEFSRTWSRIGRELPLPDAVLVISAHWLTRGSVVTAMEAPRTIHDFGGFPQALFEVQYPAPGSVELAGMTSELLKGLPLEPDHDWGLDHGCWSVVRHMYPDANVPVVQLSIDYGKPPEFHFKLGQQLKSLRKKGVLVLGSGNMVHNLRMVAWDKLSEPEYGFDWAHEMNAVFKSAIEKHENSRLIDYLSLGPAARLAIPTPDHYYPLLYTLGLAEKDEISFFNDKAVGGSLTMTSVRFCR